MGFGGSAGAMNASIKNNAALRRKPARDLLFSRDVFSNPKRSEPFQFRKPNTLRVRQLAEQYLEEKRRQRVKTWFGILIGCGIVYLVFDYLYPYLQ